MILVGLVKNVLSNILINMTNKGYSIFYKGWIRSWTRYLDAFLEKPLLGIQKALIEVRRKENRKKFMIRTSSNTNENSALAARVFTPLGNDNNKPKRKGRPWYDHCNQLGHTIESCWKLHSNHLTGNQKKLQEIMVLPKPEIQHPHLKPIYLARSRWSYLKNYLVPHFQLLNPFHPKIWLYHCVCWFSGTTGQSTNGFELSN